MGLGMELEFDKYCKLGGSPKTVLPSPRRASKLENKRSIKGKRNCANAVLILEEDFAEINFQRYRSSSCKNIPFRTSKIEGNEELLRRGSVYQSSREVMKAKKSEGVEGRRKIELSESNAIDFSFGIVDNLCSSDDDCLVMEPKISSSVISPNSDSDRGNIEDPKLRCGLNVGTITDTNGLGERDAALALRKSLSAKLALRYSPSQLESDSSRPSSPRVRFSPIRKMFDPFTKSKSQRSPLGYANSTLQKSLMNDFSNASPSPNFGSQLAKKGLCNSDVASSPAHLHGCLKLENKHGVPFFEFSLKYPEEMFVARTWKSDDALNWVYTFHSFHNRRKSNARSLGSKDWKDSSFVGQMQVSCYLCTGLKDAGDFDNSMVTEFVLYDVARARQSVSSHGKPDQSPDVLKPPEESNQSSVHPENSHFDLHPSLEIAAIVIQIPFEKRESLKHNGGDGKSDQPRVNLVVDEQRKEAGSDYSRPTKVNVITPYGNHSMPCTEGRESRGPSPLLDRWRLGGGCDCGGWDMACPLTVFGNPNVRSVEAHPLTEDQHPLELFVQGAKEKTPALTMTVIEEGRYSVDFHAQLSTLQAFSTCVAILHCTEASTAVRWERDKQLLLCNSLHVFIGEEVKTLIEAVTEEEERKINKKIVEIPASFKINPPFSPIARV